MTQAEFGQTAMLHRLPPAAVVDRIEFLTVLAARRRVIHIGFADTGCRGMQVAAGTWLHAHLATSATTLVGLDTDSHGVEAARAAGFVAHTVDCSDAAAVRALSIEPAELVIAGEIIEHLDAPGPFLDAISMLVCRGGALALTTPNASGLGNALGALAGFEVNHPGHVALFTFTTLTALLERHGWSVSTVRTYVPTVKPSKERSANARLFRAAAATLRGLELAVSRLGRPFVADGLIVVARRTGE